MESGGRQDFVSSKDLVTLYSKTNRWGKEYLTWFISSMHKHNNIRYRDDTMLMGDSETKLKEILTKGNKQWDLEKNQKD